MPVNVLPVMAGSETRATLGDKKSYEWQIQGILPILSEIG